jgi:hypothetical protein
MEIVEELSFAMVVLRKFRLLSTFLVLLLVTDRVLAVSSIPISSTLVFEMKSWQVTTDLGATAVDQLFATSKVLYRLCPNCLSTHQEIFYQRVTSIPASFSIYSNLIDTWTSTNNILNTNFQLFGSYSDFSSQLNAWQVCNYDSWGVGFPRDCGPTGLITRQWSCSSFSIYSDASTFSFYIINPPPTGVATLSTNSALDASWIIQSVPAGSPYTAGSNAYVRIDPLWCGWGVDNSVTSKWIGLTSGCTSIAQGSYIYQISFPSASFQCSSITMQFVVDDYVTSVQVSNEEFNNVYTTFTGNNDWYSLSSLTITGFGPTTTTIAFTVYNKGFGVSGLLVRFGAAQTIPGCSVYPTSQSSRQPTSQPSLLLYYPFLNSTVSGTAVANLASGFASFDASLKNGSTVSRNQLILSSAMKQYMTVGRFMSGSGGLTFTFWFRSNSNAHAARVFDFSNGPSADNVLAAWVNTGMCFQVYLGSSYNVGYSTTIAGSFNDNVLRHFGWILDPVGTWTIFINGVQVQKLSYMNYPNSISRSKNYFGRSPWTVDPYSAGAIGDFRLYDRMLSVAEVSQIYFLNRTSSQLSSEPTMQPAKQPSKQPSTQPTRRPTHQPSPRPSLQPIACKRILISRYDVFC